MTVEQGDLRLLESDLAKRLLASKIPARYAYTALDGSPRILASWFVWTGEEIVMPTFISAPHVSHAAYRVRALRANPDVAVSVDTEAFPPEVLSVRGRAEIAEVDGVVPEYAQAAHRYLGSEQATAYLAQIDDPEHAHGAHRGPPDLGRSLGLPDPAAERPRRRIAEFGGSSARASAPCVGVLGR